MATLEENVMRELGTKDLIILRQATQIEEMAAEISTLRAAQEKNGAGGDIGHVHEAVPAAVEPE